LTTAQFGVIIVTLTQQKEQTMRTFVINNEFEIDAEDQAAAQQQVAEMGIELVEIDDITDVYDGQPTEYEEWMSFDPDC
jgi:hypothetical protein